MKLNKQELMEVKGGFNITAAFITALVRGVNSFLEIGRSLGSSIRRYYSGKVCPF